MAKATVPADTAACAPHTRDCPMSEASVESSFEASLRASKAFSRDVLKFLEGRTPESRAKWAEESVEAGRFIFQPWNMEIVFVLAVMRQARFGELQRLLGGISSRTLSDKLQTLRENGLVEREVYDEQPVRIEYRLTKEGLKTAALATPLFAHLNHR
ncbi:MAG TPA: helix-turn-helix domain-containing protein [Candidatus Thermoplasmatota archaeon]|nr:helix-turn-helix domain-containing protein [Candidatus Thermoplasmatota archaeon]